MSEFAAAEPVGVVGYDNVLEIPMHFTDTSPLDVQLSQPIRLQQQSRRDFRALWKRVILDQILLIRMEKANSSLKGTDDTSIVPHLSATESFKPFLATISHLLVT